MMDSCQSTKFEKYISSLPWLRTMWTIKCPGTFQLHLSTGLKQLEHGYTHMNHPLWRASWKQTLCCGCPCPVGLCIEVNDAQERDHNFNLNFVGRGGSLSVNVSLLSDHHLEQSLLSHLAFDDLYHILSYQSWWQSSEISDPGTVPLGSLSWCNPTGSEDFDPFSAFSLSNRLTVSDVTVRCWKYSYKPLDPSFSSVGTKAMSYYPVDGHVLKWHIFP
ncbi:hypothetical protein B0H17DRAFT_348566 [Mycena rosella]|uniref:Uncharacterized protein n=1 Tax=Mycena rosella TaxID=1033263 RepID=A0AAD7GNU9_MYCRO|nr:hypothetical protein B0H17DRAFT_348566 [Mycena rosella]